MNQENHCKPITYLEFRRQSPEELKTKKESKLLLEVGWGMKRVGWERGAFL